MLEIITTFLAVVNHSNNKNMGGDQRAERPTAGAFFMKCRKSMVRLRISSIGKPNNIFPDRPEVLYETMDSHLFSVIFFYFH